MGCGCGKKNQRQAVQARPDNRRSTMEAAKAAIKAAQRAVSRKES